MKVFQSGNNTLYIADSMLNEDRRILKTFRDVPLERLISYIVDAAYISLGTGYEQENIGKFLDFCKSLSNKDGDFKVGILDAHGSAHSGKWCYSDGIIPKSVQKWIGEHDGVYDLLLLQVCNPTGIKPIIKKSLAVVPTDDVGLRLNSDIGIEHLLVIPDRGAVPFGKDKIAKLPSYDLMGHLQCYVPSEK